MSEDKKPEQAPVKEKKEIILRFGDSLDDNLQKTGLSHLEEALSKAEQSWDSKAEKPLMVAIKNATGSVTGNANKNAPRLAFTEHPAPSSNYLGLFKSKQRLIPDEIIKQIRVTDHLVAAILRTRGNMLSLYGHLRKDRFDIGLEVAIKPEFLKVLSPEQYSQVVKRIKRLETLLLRCGHEEGLEQQDKLTLSDFLKIQTQNGLAFGRNSTEIVYDRSGKPDEDGNFPFHRFRPVDVATIYRTVRKGEYVGNNLREIAFKMLESLTAEKPDIAIDKLKEDEYAWLQVIDGIPRQAFTHNELIVYNLYPSTDVEHNGYPVTPIDTVVSSITTHISIDAYIKLYFQNGRASKGMLVIQSDEVDQQVLDSLKLQFNAGMNSVSNSFRTPIFGIAQQDKVEWLPMNDKAGDGDYQYTYDQVARNIMSAFGISPDELPGYSHLSRSSNSQTLSESNNEFKLTAARDSGLRPLILAWQTFFNLRLLPIMDPYLSKLVEIRLSGIDAASKEQESTRLQQDSALHMTMDNLLEEVDKDPLGSILGGEVPFNERWQLIADKYLNVGQIQARLMNNPAALIDPMSRYKRDPFQLQFIQLMMQISPSSLRAMFAPKKHTLDFLKMEIQDSLDEDEDYSEVNEIQSENEEEDI